MNTVSPVPSEAPGLHSAFHKHERVQVRFPLPSLAKQSFKDECDINTIMARFEKTGLLDHTSKYRGRYEDVSTAVELHEALETCKNADDAFSTLPASIRKRFKNDPEEFLGWVLDPENATEVAEAGLGKEIDPWALPPVKVDEPSTAAAAAVVADPVPPPMAPATG